MFNVFKDLTEEEKNSLYERIDRLGITENEINLVNLPFTIIDSIADEELLRQVNMRKSFENSNIESSKMYTEDFSINALKEAAVNLDVDTNIEKEEYIQKTETVDIQKTVESSDSSEFVDINTDIEKHIPIKETKTIKEPKERKKRRNNISNIDKLEDKNTKNKDLFNIPILNVSSMHAYENFHKYSNFNVPTYEVILPQSGYSAKVRGLTADEIDVLRNSINSSIQSSRDDLTKTVFKCIKDTGIKNFSFADFEDYTALLDFNILLFGILHQTYGAINSFDFVCNHCSQSFKKDIITTTLVQTKSADVGNIINDIQTSRNKDETFKKSLLRTFKDRIAIPGTDIIIEIGLNNINRDKKIASYFSKLTDKEKNTRKFFLTSIVTTLFLPQYDINRGVSGYVEVTSPSDIYGFLDSVQSKAYKEIIPQINNILDKYTINFKIPDISCPHCNGLVEGSNIDMADYFLLEIIRDGFVDFKMED